MIRVLKETRYQILVIVILTFGVYFNSLHNSFVWDDHLFVEQWPAIRSFENIGEIFKGAAPEAQGKIYRPIRGLIYMVDWQMFGANPLGYRVQAVLLHISVTVLIYFIIKLISADLKLISADSSTSLRTSKKSNLSLYVTWLPFIVALVFGIHPIHTETIDYISTSLETFGSLFFFGSFAAYVYTRMDANSKRMKANERMIWRIVSVGLAGLAFFTYEMTVTLPVLLVLYEICFGSLSSRGASATKRSDNEIASHTLAIRELIFSTSSKMTAKLWPYFVNAAGFVAVRTMILGLVARSDYLGYSFYLTMVTMVKVFVRYIGLVILPVNQTAIHNLVGDFPSSMVPYDKLDPILSQTLFDLPVILSIIVIAVSIIGAIKLIKLYPIVTFGILWFWISLLPVSYIIPHGGAMAEKYLYIASFGLILACVAAIVRISTDLKRMSADVVKQALVGLGVVLVLFYGVSTIVRNRVWQNDITLFSDVVKKSPNNLIANYTLGIWYARGGNFDASGAHYLRAIDKAPEFWEARFNLANNYLRNSQAEKAKEQYKYVLNIYQDHKPAKNILANIDLVLESSPSAQPIGDLVVHYRTKSGLKFNFPAYWSLVAKSIDPGSKSSPDPGSGKLDKIVLKDAEETLNVEISDAKKYSGEVDDFIKSQKQEFGTLVNQGLAQIPSVEQAYVKVWQGKKETEGQRDKVLEGIKEGEIMLQFYLFDKGKVVKILVWPVPPTGGAGQSPVMGQFNGILGSVRVE